MIKKNKELKIKLLKEICFDFIEENDNNRIEAALSSEGEKILNEIKKKEPNFYFEKFLEDFVNLAINETIKDINEDKT